jgi:importin-7
MLIRFSKMDFENKTNLAVAFQGVTSCMRDNELPVRVQACLSLQYMIRHELGIYSNIFFLLQS